ncbi:unnamed protein product [Protopolystoma xenopodis]|uniref:Uncharacterized protein n=1 Tax=Protopolystoma xenopodis TaxID=117903 RepID=A0A448X9F5_9PLAT|nr:unnamed protein product [Protopolystoma xenopodis]
MAEVVEVPTTKVLAHGLVLHVARSTSSLRSTVTNFTSLLGLNSPTCLHADRFRHGSPKVARLSTRLHRVDTMTSGRHGTQHDWDKRVSM